MATPFVENPIIVDLTNTYGCMLVGSFLSCMMWGISSLQTFLYFAMFENDPWTRKLLVTFLWVLDTVNEILLLKSMWPVLIKNYGSIQGLGVILPELTHRSWVAVLLEVLVQLYFINRIYIFSGRKWIFPAFMVILSLYQLIILIPYDILVYAGGNVAAHLTTHRSTSIVISLRAVSVAEDVALSAVLIYLLLRNGLPKYERSKRMVVRLVIVTINTGLWTAVVALIELILVAVYPTGLQFTVVEFPLCSLYFCSLLARLNAREYAKGSTSLSSHDTPLQFTNPKRAANDNNVLYLGDLKGSKNSEGSSGVTVTTTKISDILDHEEGSHKPLATVV